MWRFRRDAIPLVICVVGSALLLLSQRTLEVPLAGIVTPLTFIGTIVLASVLGGWKSGAAATMFGLFVACFLFNPPYLSRVASRPVELLVLVAYVFLGFSLSGIGELLQRAWKRIDERQRQLEAEVSERRKAQHSERARADELMTTLASIADGVIRTDANRRITFLNPVAEELVGWKTEHAAGRMLSDVFHVIDYDSRQPAENPAVRALREGHVVSSKNQIILISRNGKERPIEDSAAPIRDISGTVIGCVLVIRDISERLRSEAAVRESEGLYRAIGESIDYGVWICDRKGCNTYASESFLRLVGLTQEECSSVGWESVLHPDDAEPTVTAWKECVESNARWDREYRLKGVDGEWHYVLSRGIPVQNELGETTSWVGINLDISRLKQVESELRDADRRKDEFLATLAHELRNPLAPIVNSLQLLDRGGLDQEMAKRTRNIMSRQIHHLVRLVDDLLDVSRVMQGKIELRPEQVDLATVLARAVETAQHLMDAKGHQLEILLPASPITMEADPVRLSQVVSNLLTNAAKYTETKGQIKLTAKQAGRQAIVTVHDNGIGILPEMLPKIFGLFVQADHSSTKSEGGLGIGLTLVKSLVEMHNGSVQAKSEGLGKGSEFIVRLPVAIEEGSQPSEIDQEDQPDVISPSGLKLLVVDDNRDSADTLAMVLKYKGHEVRVAYSGTEAIQAVEVYVPDLVLLDLGMPGMDGFEVSRQLRKTPGLEHTVLAALTGWGQDDHRKKTASAGFDHHLTKPLEPQALEILLAEIHRSLSKT